MTAEADWGPDGWAVRPGEGDFIELGGPHRAPGRLSHLRHPDRREAAVRQRAGRNGELFEELGRLGPNPPADQVADIDRRFGTTRFPGQ
jgi:hypothetical protein